MTYITEHKGRSHSQEYYKYLLVAKICRLVDVHVFDARGRFTTLVVAALFLTLVVVFVMSDRVVEVILLQVVMMPCVVHTYLENI